MNLVSAAAASGKGISVIFGQDKVDIDSRCFKLHYRYVTSALLFATALLKLQYLLGTTGDFACYAENYEVEKKEEGKGQFLLSKNNYIAVMCWTLSTMTFHPAGTYGGVKGRDFAEPGLSHHKQEGVTFHQNYYQYINIILIVQIILFHAPHFLWKSIEGDKIKHITNGLRGLELDSNLRNSASSALANYMVETLHTHGFYTISYFGCEFLSIINNGFQLFLINRVFDGGFVVFGPEILEWLMMDPEKRSDPLIRIFPRTSRCLLKTFGPSGTVQREDYVCLLPQNSLNEKIFAVMWFALVALFVFSLIHFLYLVTIITLPVLTNYVVQSISGDVPAFHIWLISKGCHAGDRFLIYLLSKNLEESTMGAVINKFSAKLIPD